MEVTDDESSRERGSSFDSSMEGANLLVNERRTTDYGSDGETRDSQEQIQEQPNLEVHGINSPRRERQRRRRRQRDGESSGTTSEGDDQQENRGFKFIYKKFLNLLPAIGDDDDEEGENSETNQEALRFGAKQMVLLVIPVFICMALVVIIQLSVEQTIQSSGQLLYTPLREDSTDNAGLIALIALGNVVIVIILVIIMTIVLVCLYKHRCYLAIQIWLMVATGILLFVFSSFFFVEVLQVHNLPLDWLSFVFLIWNFGAMGVMSVHWKGPLRLQQGYLIFCSVLTANIFIKYLPNWTAWLLLLAISIYDLFAVLCPKGPLRVLVDTAKQRNENIFPSLIYSTTMIWLVGMADTEGKKKKKQKKEEESSGSSESGEEGDGEEGNDGDHDTDTETNEEGARELAAMQSSVSPDVQRRQNARRRRRGRQDNEDDTNSREEEEEEEPRGFRLGLGDFIFYSVLVGKAAHDSHGDWVVISSCFVAILIGLCMTTLILGIVRRALPALPISIICGLLFYFTSQYLFGPLAIVLSTTQTFI